MSLAENLLNSLDETAYQNTRIGGIVPEEHIKVGQDRVITVPNSLKTIAVKGDKDIETATIDCVRYWDGHDLSTFAIYLNYILPNGDEGTYIPEGISKAEDTFSFDWLIGSEFTYAQGKMTFWIVAKLTDDSGTLIKQWSSFQNSDCTIAQGGDKIYVPEKQTDQDVISQAISISRSSAEIAEQQANLAQQAAGKAASDARDAAEAEVSRIIGELGVVQELGDSPNSVVSQLKVTEEFNKTNAKVNRNSKRITNIEQGLTPDSFETDDSVAYQKYVPANALPFAEVSEIGGVTRKCTNLVNIRDWLNPDYGTINADGSLTSTPEAAINLVKVYTGAFPSGNYTISNISGLTLYVQLAQGDYSNSIDAGASMSFTYDGTSYLCFVYADQKANTTVTYKVMLNPGDTALPYEPFFEGLRSAPVSEVVSEGVNLFGGEALANKIVEVAGGVINEESQTVRFFAQTISGKTLFDNFKTNTVYTFILSGWNEYGTGSNLLVQYTDGTVDYLAFKASQTHSVSVFKSNFTKSVKAFCGVNYSEYTNLYYNQCGIFEGDINAEDFKPYIKRTLPIPEAVRSKPWYGLGISKEVYNAIRYNEDGSRSGDVRCELYNLGELDWRTNVGNTAVYVVLPKASKGVFITNYSGAQVLYFSANLNAFVVDTSDFSSGDAAKAHFNGVYAVVALATPTTEDISDILPEDNLIGVEGGGTLTFENEHKYAVPSEVEYQVEV